MVKYPKKFAPKGQISRKIQIWPGWEICLVRVGGNLLQHWCNSFTTELVRKLPKTPKTNVVL